MEKVSDLVLDEGYWEIDDFFELLVYAAETKSKVLSKFPYLLKFSIRAFYPEHKDIKDTMDSWTQRQLDLCSRRTSRTCGLTGSATTSIRSTCSTC